MDRTTAADAIAGWAHGRRRIRSGAPSIRRGEPFGLAVTIGQPPQLACRSRRPHGPQLKLELG